MKGYIHIIIALFLALGISCIDCPSETSNHNNENYIEGTPVYVVQKQLEAYNSQDLDAFINTYSSEIKIYKHPDVLLMEGKELMRERYGKLFKQDPDRKAKILNRTILGDFVIDKEYVDVNADGSIFEAVAIYEVKDKLIINVWFITE